jgi:hypothetical protein
LFFHEPKKLRLASFDAKNPFGPGKSYTWLASQFSPSGLHNRERFVHSLAVLDCQAMLDGGWMLPLGQEESIADLVSVYRELPAKRFETLPGEIQPVVVRTLVQDGQTYVYIVNDSPWTVTLKLRVDAPNGCRLDRLGTVPLARDAEGALWSVSLRPYDLVGGRFSAANVKLSQPEVQVAEQAQSTLRRRIRDLAARVATLKDPPPLDAPANASFELKTADDQIAGWSLTEHEGASATLATEEPHHGTQSLRLVNERQVATLRSSTFPTPETGRLSVSLRLRVADPKQQPTLRLALEGRSDDGLYYRSANVGTGTTFPISKRWERFILAANDLPAEGLSELRVRFDLFGPGEVWIDDVKLFDLAFEDAERFELANLIGLADLKLTRKQLADCTQLLDGYWPHFLLAHVPLAQPTPTEKLAPKTRPPEGVENAKKPGRWDQMRDYWQKLW